MGQASFVMFAAAVPAVLAVAGAFAQEPGTQAAPPMTGPVLAAPPTPNATPSCCRASAGTVVLLELATTLSSAERQRGDRFALRLAAPLLVDGRELVPAGTNAVGEVIHAARSKGGGAPGELLLAARYVEFQGRQVPLRGMKLAATGQNRTGDALVAACLFRPFAMFMHGREIVIPAGTHVEAKLAQDFISDPAPSPPGDTSIVPQPDAAPQPKE